MGDPGSMPATRNILAAGVEPDFAVVEIDRYARSHNATDPKGVRSLNYFVDEVKKKWQYEIEHRRARLLPDTPIDEVFRLVPLTPGERSAHTRLDTGAA